MPAMQQTKRKENWKHETEKEASSWESCSGKGNEESIGFAGHHLYMAPSLVIRMD
jgi:hypothetical protein